jgi:uncharacterized protein with HEPN domain
MAADEIDRVLRIHRAQLQGLVELRGVRKMRSIYAQARAELEDKLRAIARQGRGQSFTAHHYRLVLTQLNQGIDQMTHQLGDHMKREGRIATKLAPDHMIRELKVMAHHFTGHTPVLRVEQASVVQGLVRGAEPTLLRRYQSSARLYGPPTIKAIERQMAVSLASGEGVDQATARVADTFQGERWRAERIVRTELSYSYGVTKQASLAETQRRDIPQLKKRLVATHDDREGEDSKQLDGQTVPVNDPFVWHVKDSRGNPTGKIVRYLQPPNRCNDREVVVPWDPAWGGTIGIQGPAEPSLMGL